MDQDKAWELINDVTGGISTCCGASLYMDDICMDCKEHSSPITDELVIEAHRLAQNIN